MPQRGECTHSISETWQRHLAMIMKRNCEYMVSQKLFNECLGTFWQRPAARPSGIGSHYLGVLFAMETFKIG